MMTKLNERIEKLAARTVAGEMYVHPVATEYDRTDLFLDPEEMAAKRVCEYIRNQERPGRYFSPERAPEFWSGK